MARKQKALTVNQLLNECLKQLQLGNGNKHIMLSGDDEGNSYHELFFTFTTELKGSDIEYGLPHGVTPEEFDKHYIILG